METVPELVREREHVTATRRPVEQQIRMMRRHRVGAERSGSLARSCRCVDPRIVEEVAGVVGELRRERRVRVEHEVFGLVPTDLALHPADRGHAVVVGQAVEAEELRLQRVPALRDRVPALHRRDECLDRLVARLVRQVPARDPRPEMPQAVVDRLVGEQRVEHVRTRPQTGCERVGDRGRGRLTLGSVGCVEPREPAFERRLLTVEGHLDRRHQLVEETLPRAPSGHGLLGEDDLLGLAEQVRPVPARRPQVVRGERDAGVGQQLFDSLVARARPTRARRTTASCRSPRCARRPSSSARRAPDHWCRPRSRGRRSCPPGRAGRAPRPDPA